MIVEDWRDIKLPVHVPMLIGYADDPMIRTVALTPTKARGLEFEQVRRVCHDYTLIGLEALFAAYKEGRNGNTQPFRFLYMSGFGSERDQTKTPSWEPRYCLMRVSEWCFATSSRFWACE